MVIAHSFDSLWCLNNNAHLTIIALCCVVIFFVLPQEVVMCCPAARICTAAHYSNGSLFVHLSNLNPPLLSAGSFTKMFVFLCKIPPCMRLKTWWVLHIFYGTLVPISHISLPFSLKSQLTTRASSKGFLYSPGAHCGW